MKIAQYKSLEYSFLTIDTESFDDFDGYIRLTEFVDVEFVPLPKEDVVPKQVAALEAAKDEARAKFQTAINRIDEEISKLLAITQQAEE